MQKSAQIFVYNLVAPKSGKYSKLIAYFRTFRFGLDSPTEPDFVELLRQMAFRGKINR